MSVERIAPLLALDLAQTRAAAVIAAIGADDWDRPTPCEAWRVRDIVNKLVAATLTFTAFARRTPLDPPLDLVQPAEIIGDDPVDAYLDASLGCRRAWRAPGALEGTAPSTVGEFPAKAVLNAHVFNTTIHTWDLARAIGQPDGIGDPLAAYVAHVARALVPTVRAVSPERYRDATEPDAGAPLVDHMVAITGRDPAWRPPPA